MVSAAPAEAKVATEELLRQLASGEVRAAAVGPSGFAPWQATIVVEVTPAASLDALIEKNVRNQNPTASPLTNERSVVDLPIGAATRLEITAAPPKSVVGVPARGISYYVDLTDGRVLWFAATGPADSRTFAAIIDATAASLTRR